MADKKVAFEHYLDIGDRQYRSVCRGMQVILDTSLTAPFTNNCRRIKYPLTWPTVCSILVLRCQLRAVL